MALTGSTDEEKIWNYLTGKGMTAAGVAGMMGNLFAESALKPKNLQQTYEKKLGYTDDSYTAAVDDGSYSNFVKDSAGYGLAQWTWWSRKQNLLNFAKSAGKSIGDLEMQLDFLYKELSESYKSVLTVLKANTTVKAASNAVLLNFEKPADMSASVQEKRAGYGQTYYDKYAQKSTSNTGGSTMSNSSLICYTKLSPNHSGQRTHSIDRITPHCVVGQLSCETICDCFISSSRQASCNYGIGTDGRISLCVEEKNRSWCSSSSANDQRAVTIECASDKTDPYAMNDKVYNSLVNLCVDICKRNGKSKLLWFADKDKSLNYSPAANEMVLTVHRWFANKACPGDWLYARLGNLATEVTKQLGGSSASTSTSTGEMYRVRKTWADSKSQVGAYTVLSNAKAAADKHPGYSVYDGSGNAVYTSSSGSTSTAFSPYMVKVTTDVLNIRKGPGTNYGTNGSIKDRGAYTIVEESDGTGANKWGKLKSGAGWISLDFAKKI